MDWKEYREHNEENYSTFTLEGIGLGNFRVKIRKFGSYTSQELGELEQKWVQHRFDYVAARVRKHLGVPDTVERDPLYDEVDDIIRGLDADITNDVLPDERQRKIVAFLTQEGALAKLQPLMGIDIEVIKEWNLTSTEDESKLVLPSQDMSVLEKLPLGVLWHIKEKLLEAQEAIVPPKVRRMLSS